MIIDFKTKGFTLIEVLASVLILAGTITFLISYAADGLVASMETERRIKSTLLAENELEKIKNVLRKSFETDFTIWPNSLGADYFVGRTSTNINSTLKIIEVSVGYDADKNGSLGTDEIMVTFKTQYAKRS
jgi:prepilin-type N-terminal cleavage/methylation domain-containing protein